MGPDFAVVDLKVSSSVYSQASFGGPSKNQLSNMQSHHAASPFMDRYAEEGLI